MPREAKWVIDLRATGAIEIACRDKGIERTARDSVREAMFFSTSAEKQVASSAMG